MKSMCNSFHFKWYVIKCNDVFLSNQLCENEIIVQCDSNPNDGDTVSEMLENSNLTQLIACEEYIG
jgi:hypothetical protein